MAYDMGLARRVSNFLGVMDSVPYSFSCLGIIFSRAFDSMRNLSGDAMHSDV